jgi:hypothetical protein
MSLFVASLPRIVDRRLNQMNAWRLSQQQDGLPSEGRDYRGVHRQKTGIGHESISHFFSNGLGTFHNRLVIFHDEVDLDA